MKKRSTGNASCRNSTGQILFLCRNSLYLLSMNAAFQIQFDKLADKIYAIKDKKIDGLPEIEAWRILHFAKIAKMFDSFHAVIFDTKDYITSCSLIRMIYDNWYSYMWIYEFSEGEERQLRYYLYVLDSVVQRKKTIEKLHNEVIVEKQMKRLVDNALVDCTREEQKIKTAIRNLSLFDSYKKNIETAIASESGWRYKSLSLEKIEFHSWSSLYERVSGKETRAFLNYLSQFVHGLYTSSMTIVPTLEEMSYVLQEAQSLIMSMNLYLDENPLYQAYN